jgi:hypothetical protein
MRHQLTAIKLLGAKSHDSLVHAVLHGQHAGCGWLPLNALFKQSFTQALTGRLFAFDCGWQLMVIASQHHARALGNRNPTAGLQRLGGLVDKDGFKDQVPNIMQYFMLILVLFMT